MEKMISKFTLNNILFLGHLLLANTVLSMASIDFDPVANMDYFACIGFPVEVIKLQYGYGLQATEDIKKDEIITYIRGPYVNFKDCTEAEKHHFICYGIKGYGILVKSQGRFMNHCCYPTCKIFDQWDVRTIRDVKKGEQITIRYNEALNDSDLTEFWDPEWSFECQCGHPKCKGLINGYVYY